MWYDTVDDMSNVDLQMMLKFMSGRTRLASGEQYLINFMCATDVNNLPLGHTCSFEMDLPMYKSKEDMKKKIMIAARLCGEIDDDGSSSNEEDPADYNLLDNGAMQQ